MTIPRGRSCRRLPAMIPADGRGRPLHDRRRGPKEFFSSAGPGGTLWFTEAGTNRIGELIPGSRPGLANVVEYSDGLTRTGLYSITRGRDGNFWFTERDANKIGELIPGDRPGLANIVHYD